MDWMDRIREVNGQVGVYYRPLNGEAVCFHEDLPLEAASVIKLPIMAAAFRRIAEGTLDPEMRFTLRNEDKLPSCGALTYLHEGLEITLTDLIVLMIILSDNTATNMLLDLLTIDGVNEAVRALGLTGMVVRRRLFDEERSRQGIQNTVTARGIGEMLVRMANDRLLGAPWDGKMIRILCDQRLNGKIPFFFRGVRIAHKTGEDDGITHDAAIVYTKNPFVLCVFSNKVDTPQMNRLIQDTAWTLGQLNR